MENNPTTAHQNNPWLRLAMLEIAAPIRYLPVSVMIWSGWALGGAGVGWAEPPIVRSHQPPASITAIAPTAAQADAAITQPATTPSGETPSRESVAESSDSPSNLGSLPDTTSTAAAPQSTEEPEEPNRAFRQTGCFGDEPIATDKEIRQQGLTPPSLWLTRDLLGGKIVNRWTIHIGNDELPPWVEVTFNLQPWNNLEYPRQYAYLNEFGRVAREYGYNVRVCNSRGDTLAAQFCTWDQMRGWSTCPIYLPGGFSARVRSPLF